MVQSATNGVPRIRATFTREAAATERKQLYEALDITMRPMHVLTTADETIEAVAAICRRHDARAWLFGSRAKKAAGPGSDIDIAVQALDFDAIEEEIEELDSTFAIDLVDATQLYVKGVDHARIDIA